MTTSNQSRSPILAGLLVVIGIGATASLWWWLHVPHDPTNERRAQRLLMKVASAQTVFKVNDGKYGDERTLQERYPDHVEEADRLGYSVKMWSFDGESDWVVLLIPKHRSGQVRCLLRFRDGRTFGSTRVEEVRESLAVYKDVFEVDDWRKGVASHWNILE